jgi:hypothetical protein
MIAGTHRSAVKGPGGTSGVLGDVPKLSGGELVVRAAQRRNGL